MAQYITNELKKTGGSVNFAAATTVHWPSAAHVNNLAVSSNAAISYAKLDHYELVTCSFDVVIGAMGADREQVVYTMRSAGTLRSFHAGCNDTGTVSQCEFDLKVNGGTVLSSVVTVDNTDSDREHIAGTISSAALVEGDVISMDFDDITGPGNQSGPFAVVGFDYATPLPGFE